MSDTNRGAKDPQPTRGRGRPRKQAPATQPQTPAPPSQPAAEPVAMQTVYRAKCPVCASVLSRLLRTHRMEGGRVQVRRCKSCLKDFQAWEPGV